MPVTDPAGARLLVYHVVVAWVGEAVGLPPAKVDISRTFIGNPPDGYGFSEGEYLKMCNEITVTLTQSSGRSLNLPGAWRVKHENDVIGVFINAVAILLLAAKLTSVGVKAHSWVMSN